MHHPLTSYLSILNPSSANLLSSLNPSSADLLSTLEMTAQVTKAGGSIVIMQDVLGTAVASYASPRHRMPAF